jgi:hypothetical protein
MVAIPQRPSCALSSSGLNRKSRTRLGFAESSSDCGHVRSLALTRQRVQAVFALQRDILAHDHRPSAALGLAGDGESGRSVWSERHE